MIIRWLLLTIFSLCTFCVQCTTRTYTFCNETARVKLINVTGANLNIYNIDGNYRATTAANILNNLLNIHHNTETYTYSDSTLDTTTNINGYDDLGYKPSPIILTFTQDNVAINLELILHYSIDNERFVYDRSVANGEGGRFMTPTEDGYSLVEYGDNSLTLDLVYRTAGGISGRVQGTLAYSMEEDTLTYSTVTCTGQHVGLSDTTTFNCDNGSTYATDVIDTGQLTCSPNSVPSLTYDLNVTVNQ